MGINLRLGLATAVLGAMFCSRADAAVKVTLTQHVGAVASHTDYLPGLNNTWGNHLLGGEFVAKTTASAGETAGDDTTFKTFCLEYHEEFYPGHQYYATLDDVAKAGGGTSSDYNSTLGGDPLSGATKYFYTAYRSGTLDDITDPSGPGLGFQYDDNTWGDALQLLFWRLEEEVKSDGTWNLTSGSYPASHAPTTAIVDDANFLWDYYQARLWDISNYSNGQVRVINLWNYSNNTGGAQSQLYLVGSPTSGGPPVFPPTPEPTTLAIWSLGLGIAGLVRLRRGKTAA